MPNMRRHPGLLCASVLAVYLCIHSTYCQAQNPLGRFSYETIGDTSSANVNWVGWASVNNLSQVAYQAIVADGTTRIRLWEDGHSANIIAGGAPLPGGLNLAQPTRPDINDVGQIAFSAVGYGGHQSGVEGLFIYNDGNVQRIAPSANDSGFFSALNLQINNSGMVAFERNAQSYSDIMAYKDGQIFPIARGGDINRTLGQVALSDNGDVAFYGFSSGQAIYRGNGGPLEVIAETESYPTCSDKFYFFNGPTIGSDGAVYFASVSCDYGNAIYSSREGILTEIINSHDTGFEYFGSPLVNDNGQISFFGYADADENAAIFAGTHPRRDKVIAVGDEFGLGVVSGYPELWGMNDAGQILFAVDFTNGERGIYLATPVPEPSAVALAMLSGALAALGLHNKRWWRVD